MPNPFFLSFGGGDLLPAVVAISLKKYAAADELRRRSRYIYYARLIIQIIRARARLSSPSSSSSSS